MPALHPLPSFYQNVPLHQGASLSSSGCHISGDLILFLPLKGQGCVQGRGSRQGLDSTSHGRHCPSPQDHSDVPSLLGARGHAPGLREGQRQMREDKGPGCLQGCSGKASVFYEADTPAGHVSRAVGSGGSSSRGLVGPPLPQPVQVDGL